MSEKTESTSPRAQSADRSHDRSYEVAAGPAALESQQRPGLEDSSRQSTEKGTSQIVLKPGGGYSIIYNPGSRQDGLIQSDQSIRPDGTVETELSFQKRSDGLVKQTTAMRPSGDGLTISRYADGRRTEIDTRLQEVVATRKYDASGRLVEDSAKREKPFSPGDRTNERLSERPVIRVRAGESIQRALDRAPEGSVVQVGPGVFNERLNIKRDGITLRGEGAVLDFRMRSFSGGAIEINGRRGVTVEGFEIRNISGDNTPVGIRVDGASRDISILNNNIHHIDSDKNAHGIGVFGNSKTPLSNVRIEGNKVHHLRLGQSESVVLNGNIDGFKILRNQIHDNDNIGIDIIGGEGVGRAGIDRARNGVIAFNLVYNIDSTPNKTYRAPSAAGIYVDGGSDVLIENNVVRNSNYGIELASERHKWKTERITVRGNRIEGSGLAGITLGGGSPGNGGVSDVLIQNNILRNKRDIWKQNNVENVVIRNR